MSAKTNGKPDLRFAALIRVSTEQQERTGESLRTQAKQNDQDVAFLSGKIVARYGGQEHATPGWEKGEVDRLIADAAKGKFDAVPALLDVNPLVQVDATGGLRPP
jgi:DNA invertase Pin-like site-specific DNA recombinase